MAGGNEFSRYQRGVINRYYEHIDTIALQKLSEIVSDLYLAEGGQVTKLWNSARQALTRLAPADDPHVMKVLSVRSVAGLAKLVTELQSGAKRAGSSDASSVTATTEPVVGDRPIAPPTPTPAAPALVFTPAAASAAVTPEQLKHAMKAFRKRLKLTKLDEESKLGRTGNPMSAGKKSQVVAIMAPREYSQAVWDELVRQGKLKPSGGSFYELAEGG
jgi:hypothetical protein